jgi:hypothetical protein
MSLSTPCRHRPTGGVDVLLHSFLTSALDEGEWSARGSDSLPPGKELRHPLNRRLGGPQSWYGRVGEENNLLALPGLEPWIVNIIA